MYRMSMYLFFFFAGILVSGVFLKLLVRSPFARYFADTPDHRKVHQFIIPRMGGLGIILAFMLLLGLQRLVPTPLWPNPRFQLTAALAFLCVSMLLGGGLDDVRGLDFKKKFLLQFLVAIGLVLILGRHFSTVSLLGHRLLLGWSGTAISVFWIVAVMNAFNIIDGIDGLASGTALCGFAVIAYLARSNGTMVLFALCLSLMGITLAFIRFNFSREQKMFLGDTGSQFLGAVLAVFAMEVQALPRNRFSFFVPILIVGYPLFDITVAMVRRFVKRGRRGFSVRFLRMFAADNEHLHHRLIYLGMSHLQSAFLLIMVAASMGAVAVVGSRLRLPSTIAVTVYLSVALFLILNRLGYVGLRPWLYIPRGKAQTGKIVGVIEPDEVFFHSLKSFKQRQFQFLNLPGKLTKFMGDDLIAVMLYNAASGQFDERWAMALRAAEYQNCPAIVIADTQDILRVKKLNPEGYRHIRFMEKPVRIPDLIRELERFTLADPKRRGRVLDQKFSLAELAMRNNVRS